MARLAAVCSPIRLSILLIVFTFTLLLSTSHPRFPFKAPFGVPFSVPSGPNDAYYEEPFLNLPRLPRAPALAHTIKDSAHNPKCSSDMWSKGSWVRKAKPVVVNAKQDAYTASGFTGCAAARNVDWHMANMVPEKYAWRTNVSAYDWVAPGCDDVPTDYTEALLRDLVQKGGWLLIGDSLTEEHHFSISCILNPYLKFEPDGSPGNFFHKHHLFLNPDSPVVRKLAFPEGFNITSTPIVSYRRNDLLFSTDEVEQLFRTDKQWAFNIPADFKLFGDERVYTFSPDDYYSQFLFEGPYRVIIASTGGHFSKNLFKGLPGGWFHIFELFTIVARAAIARTIAVLDSPQGQGKEFLYRPYLPGDHACNLPEVRAAPPLEDVKFGVFDYNWEWIPLYNRIFRQTIEDANHPRIHYLNIDRPGRLRPESHVLSDCLHLTVGTGVFEDWTRYIHYYLSS